MSAAPMRISPAELQRIFDGDPTVTVLDVRTPSEFREKHAPMAQPVPLDSLMPKAILGARSGDPARPVYLLCKSGARAQKAADKFRSAGFPAAVVVDGGTEGWIAAGLPVVRGKATISLERQVRIAVGSLTLLFALLAVFVHPYFAGGCAFFGAGLTFAGITDWCGLGILLSKCPWNRG